MAKYQVGWTYTVWVEVEAEDRESAVDAAMAVEYNFEDVNHTGAMMELNEWDDMKVEEVPEDEDDGQPTEMEEWHSFDPDC